MLPGDRGFRPIPRKMAGIEMITIELSRTAMKTPSDVLDNAIHLYRSSAEVATATGSACFVVSDKLAQPR